jgi:dTDP-4-dehydrorhamnose reductase
MKYAPVDVLVVGASGLVGGRIFRHFFASTAATGSKPRTVGTFCTRTEPGLEALDVTDATAVESLVAATRPKVVVLAAAYTHVDGCERDPKRSEAVNVFGARNVASAAARHGSRLIFLSSDYIFDGAHGPHAPDEAPAPLNVYGRHKLEAEHVVLSEASSYAIIRSCNIYGYDAGGKNFVMAVYRCGKDRRTMRLPSDQWGNPTYVDDVVAAVERAATMTASGVFHVAGPDYVDRPTWARRTAAALGFAPDFIEAVPTSELGQAAARPLRAGLDSTASLARLGVTVRGLDAGLEAVRAMLVPRE